MRQLYMLLRITLCICAFVPEIFSQTPQPATPSEGWRVRVTPYLWGSDFKGRIGIGDRSANVDASFADLFRELNFGFMGVVEADRDRFTTQTDLVYMNLSDEHATPGPLFSGADAIGKSFLLTPVAGYRLVGSETAFLDVLGGIRYWHVNGELKLEPGILR